MVKQAPRIAVIMPRAMHFGPEEASSIDLCVHDFVMHSRFQSNTTIFADWLQAPYRDCDVQLVPEFYSRRHLTRHFWLWRKLRSLQPDIIVVQQHLPTAAMLARLMPKTPVLVHAHNFLKVREGGAKASGDPRIATLAGVICVSHTVETAFREDYPELSIPSWTIHNGLDISDWRPVAERDRTVLLVSRSAPFKGVMEALDAMLAVLPRYPEWSGMLMLSNAAQPDFHARVSDRLQQSGNTHVALLWQQPFEVVKQRTERAAIALVPSIWIEPYGRTALEAHAGGAALISSGRGGLREISGEAALFVEEVNNRTIAEAIETLIRDEPLRKSLAEQGHRRSAELFDIGAVTARLDAVYEDVLRRRGGQA